MALGKVEICGVNTAKLPILKNEEKQALFEKIEQGDMQAREECFKSAASDSSKRLTILIRRLT